MNKVIKIRFDGTNYHGFQRQENAYTVQQAIEEAIFAITAEKTAFSGCSRTDTGVHAYEYYGMFSTDYDIPDGRIVSALNAHLPEDIAVLDAYTLNPDDDFHPRFSAKGKEYEYLVHNSRIRDPFLTNKAYHYYYGILDCDLLNKAAQDFVGTHDFAAFCSKGSNVTSTVRTIEYFNVTRDGDKIYFNVKADGFLYNMVRIMVGTLIKIGGGYLAPDCIPQILKSCDRTKAGVTAVPCGLYLKKVFY